MASSHASPEAFQQIEKQPKIDFEELRQSLSHKVELLQKQFTIKHRNLIGWVHRQGYSLHFLSDTLGKAALGAGLAASIAIGSPQFATSAVPHAPPVERGQTSSIAVAQNEQGNAIQVVHASETSRQKQQLTVSAMQQKRLEQQQAIEKSLLAMSQSDAAFEANQAAELVQELTNIASTDQLEGYRLNTNLGRIGAEQHLRLYPGQSLQDHFATPTERLKYQSSGFAAGNGAYGVFAPSASQVTEQAIQREKYYVAIQTFLSPNWASNVQATYSWFKYRKVIVYHPVTKKAVVAVVGDAGPALSTGKNYGGSPEVMGAISATDGYGTPPVMMFFVDDPDDSIPLGPVNYRVTLTGQ